MRDSLLDLLWRAQSIFGCSPQHSYWPRGSGGPFSVCSVCKHCERASKVSVKDKAIDWNKNTNPAPTFNNNSNDAQRQFLFHKLNKVRIYDNNLTSSLHQITAAVSMELYLPMPLQQWEFHVLFALPAVVCSVRLNAAALGTFVDHLPWFQLEAFYVFLSSIPFWHRPLAKKHDHTVDGFSRICRSFIIIFEVKRGIMYFIILRTLSSINPDFIKNNGPKLVYMT